MAYHPAPVRQCVSMQLLDDRFDCDPGKGAMPTYETSDGKELHRIPLDLHQLHDLQDIADAAVTILKDTE